MPTYVILGKAYKNVKGTVRRAGTFRNLAKKMRVRVKEIYWTMGQYDVVVIIDAPNDATASRLLIAAHSLGNVQTETLRAYTEKEVGKIVKGL